MHMLGVVVGCEIWRELEVVSAGVCDEFQTLVRVVVCLDARLIACQEAVVGKATSRMLSLIGSPTLALTKQGLGITVALLYGGCNPFAGLIPKTAVLGSWEA
jgi:uncharacterized membrane protein